MKFYNREREIERLLTVAQKAKQQAQFTVVTGRRRIGKTHLLLQAYKHSGFLYFFVAKKSEILLCSDFQQEVSQKLGVPILGEVTSFSALFEYVVQLSYKQNITLIIDEFQEFLSINPSVYSDIQRIWDLNKDQARLNLVVSGSVVSLMHKIFENNKEPLFGRATHFVKLKTFETTVLKEILSDFNPYFQPDDLLALYSFTGGVAKYVQLFMDNGWTTKHKMVAGMIDENSVFIAEGKNLLIEEFGKEYSAYFSILSAISEGKNSRNEIENLLKKEIGGYLTKMERDLGLIKKNTPIFAKSETKNVKYTLEDNFLTFWFRFIYKYSYIVEIGAYEQLIKIIERDYTTFSGLMLEKMFRTRAVESRKYTQIGSFWDRKGETEIDFIAVNDLHKTIDFAEIKRKKENISLRMLEEKAYEVLRLNPQLRDYQYHFHTWSLDDL
ncbi:ATP-binding protein [Capnocytophaga sp.]|uniref:ATP-binding protein n=1 Tax=Capnocytophaga sp. TaxID=44737 RepID=UPI0026DAD5DE|nr:ATP-binding protein [Capnocytophaga sp.]MDO5104291.1 ATP-binding protein [Capnocytophaga sp.]